jgi:hypothetical protein
MNQPPTNATSISRIRAVPRVTGGPTIPFALVFAIKIKKGVFFRKRVETRANWHITVNTGSEIRVYEKRHVNLT